jgi:hypothetical protein
MKAAGLKYSPHILRHFAGSLWVTRGVPIEKVSRQLGHRNINFTNKTYLHEIEARESQGRTAMRELGGAFNGVQASLPPPETVSVKSSSAMVAPAQPTSVIKLNGPTLDIPANAPDWVAYAVQLFEAGRSMREVTGEIGRNECTVYQTFRRLDLPSPQHIRRTNTDKQQLSH